jgi:hypothetical protein
MYYILCVTLIGAIVGYMTGYWIAVPIFLVLSLIPADFLIFSFIVGAASLVVFLGT